MHKIIVIGTDPPCPRCGILLRAVEEEVKELGIDADVIHMNYTDDEARKIADQLGLIPGTAKDVLRKQNSDFDFNRFSKIKKNYLSEENTEYQKYNSFNWTYELDEFLRPFEKAAKEQGILMTPIMVIDDVLIHMGSVPRLKKLKEILAGLVLSKKET
ncbi:MAG: thioredoxin family protein [Clostridia bacterium]|nr:thioredoxin family protein [Clostridia bacterium]